MKDGKKTMLLLVLMLILMSLVPTGPVDGNSDPLTRDAAIGWINGTVVDELTDKKISGCFVEIDGTTINTNTNESGMFSFEVSPGTVYILNIKKNGYDMKSEISPILNSGTTIWINVSLLKNVGKLLIFYTGGGEGAGAEVTVNNFTDEKIFSKTESIGMGSNVLKGGFAPWELEVPAPARYAVIGITNFGVYTPGQGVAVTKSINISRGETLKVYFTPADFQPSSGKLKMITKYGNGTPTSGVDLIIIYTNIQGSSTEYKRMTNTLGEFIHEGQPGNYNITIEFEGYIKETKTVELKEGETIDLEFTMRADKGGKVNNGDNAIIIIMSIIALLVLISIISAITIFLLRRKIALQKKQDENEYICPKCGTVVDEKAVKCPKCKFKFPWKQFRCPECGKILEYNSRKCIECGNTEFELK